MTDASISEKLDQLIGKVGAMAEAQSRYQAETTATIAVLSGKVDETRDLVELGRFLKTGWSIAKWAAGVLMLLGGLWSAVRGLHSK